MNKAHYKVSNFCLNISCNCNTPSTECRDGYVRVYVLVFQGFLFSLLMPTERYCMFRGRHSKESTFSKLTGFPTHFCGLAMTINPSLWNR